MYRLVNLDGEKSAIQAGREAIVLGWGFTDKSAVVQKNLRETKVKILNREICRKDQRETRIKRISEELASYASNYLVIKHFGSPLDAPDRQKVETALISTFANFPPLQKEVMDDSTTICAGSDLGGTKDACPADSGGPLLLETKPNEFTQIGIVSIGSECNRATDIAHATVYTRVSQFRRWIDETKQRVEKEISSRLRCNPDAVDAKGLPIGNCAPP
jgi:hypothetical protein